jgi:transposase InsO family protein
MEFQLQRLYKHRPLLPKYDRWRAQGKALGLSKKALQKLDWFIYYHEHGERAAVTARYFGITRKTFYKWFSVFDPKNLRALEEGSRRPQHFRTSELPRDTEVKILALRKANPEFGKMKLKALYQKIYKEPVTSWSIQIVIEKHHLQRKPSGHVLKFRKQASSKRKTIALKREQKPGFLVAFDSIELRHNGIRRYIVTGIDTVSKVAWARAYKNHSSVTTRDFLIRFYAVVHGNILNVCSDNGSEFEQHFAEALHSLDIPHHFSRVHTPKDNPISERFNGTLKREFLRMGNWTEDIVVFNQRLSQWLLKYNCLRPHQTLGYKTPFEYHFNQALVTDVSV